MSCVNSVEPVITYAPGDIIALEGSNILLSCEVSSYPVASIQWKKEGDSTFLASEGSNRAIQVCRHFLYICCIIIISIYWYITYVLYTEVTLVALFYPYRALNKECILTQLHSYRYRWWVCLCVITGEWRPAAFWAHCMAPDPQGRPWWCRGVHMCCQEHLRWNVCLRKITRYTQRFVWYTHRKPLTSDVKGQLPEKTDI